MALALPPSLRDSPVLPVAISVAAVAATATAVLLRRAATRSPSTTPDGRPLREVHALPNPHWLVGDLLSYIEHAEHFHDWLAETSLAFSNEPWRLRIRGQTDLIVLTTPDAFEEVLVKQSATFPRGEYANSIIEGVLGRSLLTSDGDEWFRQRKTAAKFFTAKALRRCMTTTMHKNVLQLYEVLDAHVTSGAALDLSHLLGQFTLQTFSEVGLGVDLRWIGTDEPNPIDEVSTYGSPTVMRRFRVPTMWWKLEKALKVGPERKLHEVMATTRAWLQTLITKSLNAFAMRQQQEKNDDGIKSVVELFFEHSQEDQTGLRADDMVDFILTFVLAAQDTSSITLTRFFLMLAKHPHVAERVRQETAAVLPTLNATRDTYLTTDHVQHLVYLEATIKEVLRLYPTAPLVQRETLDDTVICGDIPVPQGTTVCLQVYAMARNPDVWGPDAAEFKPERWIDDATGQLRSVPPTQFASFGAGPHLCIGMKLGMLELRVVAANLVHRYNLSLAAPNNGDYLVGITLLMKDPLMVHVQPTVEA